MMDYQDRSSELVKKVVFIGRIEVVNAALAHLIPGEIKHFSCLDTQTQLITKDNLRVIMTNIPIKGSETDDLKRVKLILSRRESYALFFCVFQIEKYSDTEISVFESVLADLQATNLTHVLWFLFTSCKENDDEVQLKKMEDSRCVGHLVRPVQEQYLILDTHCSQTSDIHHNSMGHRKGNEKLYELIFSNRQGFSSPLTRADDSSSSRWMHTATDFDRNIVIVGKVGVGKSTVANAIFSSAPRQLFAVGSSIGSVTRSPRENISQKYRIDGYNYTITVVDTVGLGNKKQIIERLVQSFKENHRIHLLIFVIKFDRLTDEEVDSVNKILIHLKKHCSVATLRNMTALVITHCETIEEQQREEIGKQYCKSGSKLETLAQLTKRKTCLVGLPEMSTVSTKLRALIQEERDEDVKKLQELVKGVCANPSPDEIVFDDVFFPDHNGKEFDTEQSVNFRCRIF